MGCVGVDGVVVSSGECVASVVSVSWISSVNIASASASASFL